VTVVQQLDLAALAQTLTRVLAECLEHPVARAVRPLTDGHQRAIDERVEEVEHRLDRADLLDLGERDGRREHPEPREQHLLIIRQELVGPVDRAAQARVALGRPGLAPREQPEPLVQAIGDLARAQ